MERFVRKSVIAAPAELVFEWHEAPDAFEKLTPPWARVRVVERSGEGIKIGTRIVLEMNIGPFRQRWVATHTAYERGQMFRDEQLHGPFKHWVHTHSVEPNGDYGCTLIDDISYELRFGLLGRLAGAQLVRRKLKRLFEYRHAVTREECELTRSAVLNQPNPKCFV